jgi:hypothetical protein
MDAAAWRDLLASWSFADPPNTYVFTIRQVIDDRLPVLLVFHDADDGAWQFLSGAAANETDARIVSLAGMIVSDPSLAELADLPRGWKAWRIDREAPWQRGPAD